MIEHGRTGFLAKTPAEWAEAVAKLANDPQLRATMAPPVAARSNRSLASSAGPRSLLDSSIDLDTPPRRDCRTHREHPPISCCPTLSFADDDAAGQAA